MTYKDLHDFIRQLDKNGLPERIDVEEDASGLITRPVLRCRTADIEVPYGTE